MPETPPDSREPRRGSRRPLVAGSILAFGLTLSVALYVTSPPDAPESDAVLEMQSSKKSLRDLERIGGKAAVMTSQLDDWLSSLWHGEALAYTTAVLTLVAAGACWLLWPLFEDEDAPL